MFVIFIDKKYAFVNKTKNNIKSENVNMSKPCLKPCHTHENHGVVCKPVILDFSSCQEGIFNLKLDKYTNTKGIVPKNFWRKYAEKLHRFFCHTGQRIVLQN